MSDATREAAERAAALEYRGDERDTRGLIDYPMPSGFIKGYLRGYAEGRAPLLALLRRADELLVLCPASMKLSDEIAAALAAEPAAKSEEAP